MQCGTVKSIYRNLLVVAFLFCGGSAFARPEYFDVFTKFYSPQKGTTLQKAGCGTCHGSTFQVRNAYGRAVRRVINPNFGQIVTPDVLIYLEKQDSDGDGYTNLEEIVSGTLPGVSASHPASHPTNLPEHHISRKLNVLNLQITGGVLILSLLLGIVATRKPSLKTVSKIAWIATGLAVVATGVLWLLSNRKPF